jgi:hypothetical protein
VVAGCDRGIVYSIKAPGGSWTTTTLAPPANRIEVGPQIAFDGSTEFLGYTLVAPNNGCGGGYDDIGVYYRTRTLPTGAWSNPVRIGAANNQLDSFRESGGQLYVTVDNPSATDGGFALVTKNGATQHSYPIHDAIGPVSMRVGTDGRAQITYASLAGIGFGLFGGSGFANTTAIRASSEYAFAPILVLDAANKAHVLYTYTPHGGCAVADKSPKDGTYYATNESGTWKAARFTTFAGESSLQIDDASGRVHALVADRTDSTFEPSGLTYFTEPVGGPWSSMKLTHVAAASPVIRLDQVSGALLVAFLGRDGIYIVTRS